MGDNSRFIVFKLNSDETLKIKKKWENSFVPIGIDIEKIPFEDMLWHIFSYNARECEKGEQARDSFKDTLNDNLYSFYLFHQYKDTGYIIDNKFRAFLFDDLSQFITDHETADIYITDKEFNWTFVLTHEDGWLGPYFCKRHS